MKLLHFILVVTLFPAFVVVTKAQNSPTPTDSAISKLADQIAQPLRKLDEKRIWIADFKGPQRQTHPFGIWLASKISACLKERIPKLEIMDDPKAEALDDEAEDSLPSQARAGAPKERALKVGAKALVDGSFGKTTHGIGVSIVVMHLHSPEKTLLSTSAFIPISDEITALSPNPIPSPGDSVALPNFGGVSAPACVYCPPPLYTWEARGAGYQGTVTLLIVVTVEGRATNISVVKGPGLGLEGASIEAVKKWRFRPAKDAEGIPVSARVPIQVTFHLR